MTPDKSLVAKSVRLPACIVEFIEGKAGRDFSKKLVYVLEDYINGDAARQEILKEYDALVEKKRKELQQYRDILFSASDVSAACAEVLEAGTAMLQEMEHEHLPRDANTLSAEESLILGFYREMGENSRRFFRNFIGSL